jgi:hypothetical protein
MVNCGQSPRLAIFLPFVPDCWTDSFVHHGLADEDANGLVVGLGRFR